MRRITLCFAIMILTFAIGFSFSVLWNARHISWPHLDTLCGVSDIQNPLCNYSPDLQEVPTVEFCQVVNNPQPYDRKIIRIRGTFVREDNDAHNAHIENRTCLSSSQRMGVSYWDGHTISGLMDYLDVFAPASHNVDVVIVGEFIDRAGHGYEQLGGARFSIHHPSYTEDVSCSSWST